MLQQIEEARARVRELEETSESAAREAVEAKAQIIAAANAAIDEIIRASGLTYGEILGQPVPGINLSSRVQDPKQAKKRSGNGGDHPRYMLIGDPDCTYSRGPLPLWMKREMEAKSLDPADKQDREAFRMAFMVQA